MLTSEGCALESLTWWQGSAGPATERGSTRGLPRSGFIVSVIRRTESEAGRPKDPHSALLAHASAHIFEHTSLTLVFDQDVEASGSSPSTVRVAPRLCLRAMRTPPRGLPVGRPLLERGPPGQGLPRRRPHRGARPPRTPAP